MAPSRTKTPASAKPDTKTFGARVVTAGFRAKFLERALIEWHAEQLSKLEATAAQRRGVLAKVKEEANRVEAARRKEEQAATKLYRKDVAARQAIVAEAEERQKAVKLQEDGLLQAMHAAGNAIKGASKDALKAAREQMRAQVDNMFPA